MKTLTIKKGGNGDYVSFKHGRHNVVISKAAYGEWQDKKYLDVFFEGLPESFNLRTYAKVNPKTNEEFSIMQVFRFANAGISDSLDSQTGETVLKIDDSPDQLVGKNLNIFMYKDGEYYRALTRCAPTVFEGVAETFSDKDVEYWKKKAVSYFDEYVAPNIEGEIPANGEIIPTAEASQGTSNADMPF